jgi:hypothetical protein
LGNYSPSHFWKDPKLSMVNPPAPAVKLNVAEEIEIADEK